jgi:Fe2+ or Zn2+ uptake regulation protein
MTDFAGCQVAALVDELGKRTSYEITSHRLELYGICPDCRNEEEVEG